MTQYFAMRPRDSHDIERLQRVNHVISNVRQPLPL